MATLKKNRLWYFYGKLCDSDISKVRSINPELQNRVTHYEVTNRVTNSKISFFKMSQVSNSM